MLLHRISLLIEVLVFGQVSYMLLLVLLGAVGSMFTGQAGSAAAGSSHSGQPEFVSGRDELLYGAKQADTRGKGGVRSAAEIRSAYGRSSTRYEAF